MIRSSTILINFLPGTKTRTLYRPIKDRDQQNAGGCYAVPCKNCDSKYIGRTRRPLNIRTEEHHRDISAVAIHAKETKHEIDYNKTHFIIRESKEITMKWLEAILIQQSTKPLMNRKKDRGIKIPSVWSPCLPNLNYHQQNNNDNKSAHTKPQTKHTTTTTIPHYLNFIPQSKLDP